MVKSDPTGMQAFYEHINGADIWSILKEFLTHEDANLRAKACSAIGNMCRHSSYFYSLLVMAHISNILLLYSNVSLKWL